MDAGLGRKLTLVSSPAGSGKTTLLSEWGRRRPVAWLSLDRGDNDPIRFWLYFTAALKRVNPELGKGASQRLQSPQPPPLEKMLTVLINETAAQENNEAEGPYTIILDDYHIIEAAPIHESLAFLLDHLPRCLHLVLATRADPPLPLARLRGQGNLNEIRAADLRFTVEETAVFLTKVMNIDLEANDVAALHHRTEGWIAGIQLAALSMQGRDDARRFVRAFVGSNRYIMDYLVEEVFKQQPAGTRTFLLHTSILERFCADLCDALLKNTAWQIETVQGRDAATPSTQLILEQLETSNLFIVPLDDEGGWYRYHHLFADLLRHRLLIAHGETFVARLHLRASRWYENQGLAGEAIDHALAARDWERAGTLINNVSEMMLKRSEVATLLRWYRRIPDEEIRERPRLCYAYSWPLLLTGQLESAESYLSLAETAVQEDAHFLAEVTSAQAFCARVRGDHARTIHLSEKALSLLAHDEKLVRGIVTMNLGIAAWSQGQLNAAERAFSEAEKAAARSGNVYSRLTAVCYLGRIQAVRGDLHGAALRHQQSLQLGKTVPATAASHLELSHLCYEWNQLDTAATHLQQAFALSQQSGNVDVEIGAYHMHALLQQARGNEPAARDALEVARRLLLKHNVADIIHAQSIVYHVEIAVAQADLAAAQRWASGVADLRLRVPLYTQLGLVPARIHLAENEKKAAFTLLHDCYQKGIQDALTHTVIKILLLQALAVEQENALSFLSEALQLARPQQYIRTFVDEGEPIAALLRRAHQKNMATEYVATLLDHFPVPASIAPTKPPLAEPLSERELEVLQALAAGHTYEEISQTLVISINTVKTHLRNIYGKLGVSNRRQASLKAEALNLLR